MFGKQLATYWMHNGMMQLSGAKMSKSLGNLVTIDSFLEQYEANVLRLMILNSSYRGPLTFNEETIEHAEKALKRLRSALKPALPKKDWEGDLNDGINLVKESFLKTMDDDFNTAGALGFIFDYVKEINHTRDEGADHDSLSEAQAVLIDLTGVLGLQIESTIVKDVDPSITENIYLKTYDYYQQKNDDNALEYIRSEIYSADVSPDLDFTSIVPDIDYKSIIEVVIHLRDQSREKKDWESSDYLRDLLSSSDIVVEDSDQGTTWYKK
jgi:cysteinyl-tRNA synthetase